MMNDPMPNLDLIKSQIFQIGEELTKCDRHCVGIRNEPNNGIVPRGLIYEDQNGNGSGVIVVGLNPGVAKANENKYRLERGLINYGVVVDCWRNEKIRSLPYFKKPRLLMNELGLFGDILWTNIAKCECLNSKERISFSSSPQTFRICSVLYLKKELSVVPATWPMVACGKDAFTALSYLYPDRKIIGIPHPTGAGIEFRKLFGDGKVKDGNLKQSVKNRFKEFFSSEQNGALWLREK
jgi:hypothetical protein